MRLKDYGRNSKLRKVYVQSSGLLIVGVDIGKASHSRQGFDKCERNIRKLLLKPSPNGC